MIALLIATYFGRLIAGYGFIYADVPLFSEVAVLIRRNLLKHILRRPGAAPLPDSPGEAVSRFRNDVMEIPLFMLWFNDIVTGLAIIALSIGMMANISPGVTLVALTPVVLVGFIANATSSHIQNYRRASRQARTIDDAAEILVVSLEVARLLVGARRGQIREDGRELLHRHRRDRDERILRGRLGDHFAGKELLGEEFASLEELFGGPA